MNQGRKMQCTNILNCGHRFLFIKDFFLTFFNFTNILVLIYNFKLQKEFQKNNKHICHKYENLKKFSEKNETGRFFMRLSY